MPIDDDARVAITLRLQTAYAETLENYTRKPAWIELLGDVALAQQWLTIEATYSGVEQTLKYLIALQKDFTIDELLDQERHRGEAWGGARTTYTIPHTRTRNALLATGWADEGGRRARLRSVAVTLRLCQNSNMRGVPRPHPRGMTTEGHLHWRYCLIQGHLPPVQQRGRDARNMGFAHPPL